MLWNWFYKKQNILNALDITPNALTQLVNNNPSLKGMIVGYVAEEKLKQLLLQLGYLSTKENDHDRSVKHDLSIEYNHIKFRLESKSLQTNSVEIFHNDQWIPRINKIKQTNGKYRYVSNKAFEDIPYKYRLKAQYRGKAQCDASDKREIILSNGEKVSTTCLQRGEFDILAINLFAFRDKWDFAFILNSNIPSSNCAKYSTYVKSQLLATTINLQWPLELPYTYNINDL